MAGKSSRKPKAAPKKTERVRREFLLIRVGEGLTTGSSMTLVGVAESLAKARTAAMSDVRGGVGKVAIVEKRAIVERQQRITGMIVRANIVTRPKE